VDITPIADWLLNQSIPIIILVGIGWFLVRKFWPWLTEVYLPAQQELDKETINALLQVAAYQESAAVALEHFAANCLNLPSSSQAGQPDKVPSRNR
jgi:hypothetical protein